MEMPNRMEQPSMDARTAVALADPLILEPVGAQEVCVAHPDAMLNSILRAPDFGVAEAVYAETEAKVAGMLKHLDFATEDSAQASLAAICSIYASARQRAWADLHRQCEQALSSVDRLIGSWEGTTLGLKREISLLEAECGQIESKLAELMSADDGAPATREVRHGGEPQR